MDPRQAWRLARRAVGAWTQDYAPSMGAALSYYALFSIAPLLLIVIGVAGFFFGDQAARGEIFGQIAGMVGAEGAHAVESLVASARKPESGLLAMLIGTVLLITGASTVFGELQNALDRIWRAPARVATHIRVQPAANSPIAEPGRPVTALAKLGAALALGIGASLSLGFLRRR